MADPTGKTLLGVSKSTISGILTALIAICTSLLAYTIPATLLTPGTAHTVLWVNVVINVILIICKAVLGTLQGDAPLPAAGTK
jgi:hypothetical protein